MDVVLIPAYQPGEALVTLAQVLADKGLALLVVDDGSGPAYAPVFDRVREAAAVLTLPRNGGKGAALRRGIAQLRAAFPACTHFITADADGQHSVRDILRLTRPPFDGAEAVLTERDLGRDTPFRSRFGNDLSRWMFVFLLGRYFRDNQSGLRRFSVDLADRLLEARGERYDYELNVIYRLHKQGVPLRTTPIETIYLEGNAGSHFQPLQDTLRIYRCLFSSARASICGAVLAQTALAVLSGTLGYRLVWLTLPLLGLVSGAFCQLVNRLFVFRGRPLRWAGDLGRVTVRYLLLGAACAGLGRLLPRLPLFWAVQLLQLLLLPLRWFFHKGRTEGLRA